MLSQNIIFFWIVESIWALLPPALITFHKTEFIKKYKQIFFFKNPKFPAKSERSVLPVSDRLGTNQNALFRWMDRSEHLPYNKINYG